MNLRSRAQLQKTITLAQHHNQQILQQQQQKPEPAEADPWRSMQPQFPSGDHDSLQYHFFAGPIFVATRVFRSKSLLHSSVWMHDSRNGKTVELLNHNMPDSEAPVSTKTSTGWTLVMADKQLTYSENKGSGSMALTDPSSATGQPILDVSFSSNPSSVFVWGVPGQSDGVIHRVRLLGHVTYCGERFDTVGYSKRYFGPYPWSWGYRFMCGVINNKVSPLPIASAVHESNQTDITVWTADATFGDDKYNYFNLVRFSSVDGQEVVVRVTANTEDTYQQANKAFSVVDGVKHELQAETIGEWWETTLETSQMKSRMRQRLCEMTLRIGGVTYTGKCLNEVCFGTLA